ncbi:MAG: polyprenyl synthetase family protein [Chthonomonas sp.]|nr:polyprenyl synthetase family protein [Chthonomonas sp.]
MKPLPSAALLDRVQGDLALVEAELLSRLESKVAVVHQVLHHTLTSGGKRLRPALVLTSARAAGAISVERAVLLSAVLEMVHMATLIHDDVIDNADLRRGRPTAARVFGNTPAILSGDVLLARSMALLAEDGDLDIIRLVSQAVIDLAEGEAREVEVRGDFELTRDDHMEILRLKTAVLVQLCCELGAMSAGADLPTRTALATYGHHIGLAFQIADDLLDYRGKPEVTGKPVATDFHEGCATLPLLILREKLTAEETEFAASKFGGSANDDEVRMIVSWMDQRGCFAEVEALALEHVNHARAAIADLPPSAELDFLTGFAHYVVHRDK